MRKIACIVLSLFYLLGGMMTAVADPAPVYDADAMSQQLDEAAADNSQDLPPPTPPAQEGTYRSPSQATANNTPILVQPQALSLEQRVRRAEQQINNMQNTESASQIEGLQGQVQALRGQVEQLAHQLEELQKQQTTMYSDLDRRLAQAKRMVTVPINYEKERTSTKANNINKSPITNDDSALQPNVAEEQKIYQTAYNFIKNKRYNEAVATLQGMLKKYPSGQFASNAHYWLGELYGLLGKNEQALAEFTNVVTNFPDSPRIADAQLKVGLIYAAQLKWVEAKNAMRKVINHYPGTASARLAKEQIKQIAEAGH